MQAKEQPGTWADCGSSPRPLGGAALTLLPPTPPHPTVCPGAAPPYFLVGGVGQAGETMEAEPSP